MVRTRSPERREQLLHISAAIFASKGYHRAHVSDIIDEAGVARGTFYLYFESKRQVFDELLKLFLGKLMEGIRRIDLGSETPPLTQLEENLQRAMTAIREYRDIAIMVLGSIEAPDPEVKARVDRFFHEVRELVSRSLATGRSIGLVREVPGDIATHFVFGGAREVCKELVARKEDEDIARLARTLVELTSAGLLAGLRNHGQSEDDR